MSYSHNQRAIDDKPSTAIFVFGATVTLTATLPLPTRFTLAFLPSLLFARHEAVDGQLSSSSSSSSSTSLHVQKTKEMKGDETLLCKIKYNKMKKNRIE